MIQPSISAPLSVFAMDLWHMCLWIIGTTVSAVAISRWSSHGEHQKNLDEVRNVHACIDKHMNGADGQPGVIDRLTRIEEALRIRLE